MKFIRAKKRIGIGIRLAIMVAVLIIIATGSFTVLSLLNQRRQAMNMFEQSSFHMGQSLERLLRLSMLENRREEIESSIRRMAMGDAIESVTLVTHTGKPVYKSTGELGENISIDDTLCSGCHLPGESRTLDRLPAGANISLIKGSQDARIALPIYNEPECYTSACHAHSEDEGVLGIMQLDISYAYINESLARYHKNLIMLSVFIALVTSLVIIELIRRWVSNPVRDLLEGTRRVADGEWGHVIPVGEAELGALARAFNKMQAELRSSQRQLITAEKLASIGKLAASVAHEINNPLTGILAFAEDLADEAEPGDPRLSDYQVIQREAMRCREIVKQLLDFSRQDKPDLRSVDMNEMLSHMVTFVAKQAIFRNIEIKTDLQRNLPPVTADPAQIEQVILGILVNASESMPEGGKILIDSFSQPENGEVSVSISDTGPGIPEENLQKIFEPFFSTKGGSSLGIGLAVSWNIIDQHGGRLEVHSELGKGTTFRIVMPGGKQQPAAGASA